MRDRGRGKGSPSSSDINPVSFYIQRPVFACGNRLSAQHWSVINLVEVSDAGHKRSKVTLVLFPNKQGRAILPPLQTAGADSGCLEFKSRKTRINSKKKSF